MDVLEAIGDTNRRRIVELLTTGERSAGEIAAQFAISRPGVSQHLGVLVSAGALVVRKVGRERRYALHPDALGEVELWLQDQQRRWASALDALEQAIAADEGTPDEQR